MLVHHEVGGASRSEPCERPPQQVVKGCFADPNGRIGPDGVEGHLGIEPTEGWVGVHSDGPNTRDPGRSGVFGTESSGAGVGVESPHGGVGAPQGEADGDRAPATPKVRNIGELGLGSGTSRNQQGSALIERTVGEHPGVAHEGEPLVVNDDLDRSGTSRKVIGRPGEVVGEWRRGFGGVRHGRNATLGVMVPYDIRVIGDPVLTQRASEVTDIDSTVAALVDDMFEVMYDAPGVGLAAPQVGVSRRIFVYDSDERAGVLINPVIAETDGEWEFVEGCLSIPGLHWSVVRPRTVLLRGVDLDGNAVELEATDFEARIFQHELDHLDGVLLTERLTEEQRRDAKRALLDLTLGSPAVPPSGGLQLP